MNLQPAAARREEQVVGGVLIGGSVVGVADVAAHGQSQQLAHEVILQPGPDDLPFVEQVFRPDEADDRVDEEGVERSGYAVGAGFERELIDAVMGAGRKSTALAGLKIHDLLAHPRACAPAMMFEHALAAGGRRLKLPLRLLATLTAILHVVGPLDSLALAVIERPGRPGGLLSRT
jgi:hypothetical protein